MTQIIALLTKEYVLLASDRKLTDANTGRQLEDNKCKLVSLCNSSGIAYSGRATIGGKQTHVWIGKVLADEGCRAAKHAAEILVREANKAFAHIHRKHRGQYFLMTGWSFSRNQPLLLPYHAIVSNMLDDDGSWLSKPRDEFNYKHEFLPEDVEFRVTAIGEPMRDYRISPLNRNIRLALKRGVGPQELLRIIVEEVIFTSKVKNTVGDKVLGMCIPKVAVERTYQTGRSHMLAMKPGDDSPAFMFFDSGYDEALQFGPTFVSGRSPVVELKTTNDPNSRAQSSEMKILYIPEGWGSR